MAFINRQDHSCDGGLSEEEQRLNYVAAQAQQSALTPAVTPAQNIEYTLYVQRGMNGTVDKVPTLSYGGHGDYDYTTYCSYLPWKNGLRKRVASSKDVDAILKLKNDYEKGVKQLGIPQFSRDYGLLYTVEADYATSSNIVFHTDY